MNILMVAAENGALPGGKVGGMGDVIRDIPVALMGLGHRVDVVIPGYQHFSRLPGAVWKSALEVRFGRALHSVDVFLLEQTGEGGTVRCWVLEHDLFAPNKAGEIYCNDPPQRPFATDGSKFALFSAAVCEALLRNVFDDIDAVHLHDWHMALIAVLTRFDTRFQSLNRHRLVYTIHNLALQGIRPFTGDESALESWFPYLKYDRSKIVDPRYPDCINPMRAAINLCDRIHAVSPTYAEEIQRPSDPDKGFYGGEGLEVDLQQAHRVGKLKGILNGCVYSAAAVVAKPDFVEFLDSAERQLNLWIAASEFVPSANQLALNRIAVFRASASRPRGMLTSVGRLTAQKVLILMAEMDNGLSCIDLMLNSLPANYLFVMLGSGDKELERFFTAVAARHGNFLFLKGFAETLSDDIYSLGDLFLMPSSFEPCGISQMLAMRAGQPCLVHGVGGLADTVQDEEDGFVFYGDGQRAQAEAFISALTKAIQIRESEPKKWQTISAKASEKRFLWRDAAEMYYAKLYR